MSLARLVVTVAQDDLVDPGTGRPVGHLELAVGL
jgi:hypothetical protein